MVMKRIILSLITISVLLITACKRDDQDRNVKSDAVTILKVQTSSNNLHLWLAGSGNAVIDWGDGAVDKAFSLSPYTFYDWLSSGYTKYLREHVYNIQSDYSSRIIKIEGDVTHIDCMDVFIENVDISKNSVLTYLSLRGCKMTGLDVNDNIALTHLNCQWNELTSLDVSKNSALQYLECRNNQITALKVSNNTALVIVNCNSNRMEANEINSLFHTLPVNNSAVTKIIDISRNPGTDACDMSIATTKGWTVRELQTLPY
jgi:hypothetical protein